LNHAIALRSAASSAILALLLGTAAGCAVLEPPVVRSVGGVTTEGRFIEADAYALYAVAALHETRGQWPEALELYQRALAVDGRGPELRTRIGAVACKLRQYALADRSFSAAMKADGDYGPLWFELAQCRKTRGDLPGAQSAALEAVRLDPERAEASLLAADVAEQRGDAATAWRLRDSLVTHLPDSLVAQRAVLSAAERAQDVGRARRAQQALAALHRSSHGEGQHGLPGALAALQRGDTATAKRISERLLGSDPGNGDALVIALCVADLEQDHAAFAELLARAEQPGTPASAQVLGVLESLLGRRVSAQAAQLVRPRP
jgi:tetratricopeptide (TPR) repeat protein